MSRHAPLLSLRCVTSRTKLSRTAQISFRRPARARCLLLDQKGYLAVALLVLGIVVGGCADDSTQELPTGTCGNGVLEHGEACDDGNLEDGDGCSAACTVETTSEACVGDCTHPSCATEPACLPIPARCDAENPNCALPACQTIPPCDDLETCDDAEPNCGHFVCRDHPACRPSPPACRDRDPDCANPRCAEHPACLAPDCPVDDVRCDDPRCARHPRCRGPACGNGIIDPGEECDDGALNSDTTPNACRSNCSLPVCGDGVVDNGPGYREACDGGPGCSPECTIVPFCGDGVVDTGEACDDGADNSDVIPDACRTDCQLATCGDGVVDRGEQCDVGTRVDDDATCRVDCTWNPDVVCSASATNLRFPAFDPESRDDRDQPSVEIEISTDGAISSDARTCADVTSEHAASVYFEAPRTGWYRLSSSLPSTNAAVSIAIGPGCSAAAPEHCAIAAASPPTDLVVFLEKRWVYTIWLTPHTPTRQVGLQVTALDSLATDGAVCTSRIGCPTDEICAPHGPVDACVTRTSTTFEYASASVTQDGRVHHLARGRDSTRSEQRIDVLDFDGLRERALRESTVEPAQSRTTFIDDEYISETWIDWTALRSTLPPAVATYVRSNAPFPQGPVTTPIRASSPPTERQLGEPCDPIAIRVSSQRCELGASCALSDTGDTRCGSPSAPTLEGATVRVHNDTHLRIEVVGADVDFDVTHVTLSFEEGAEPLRLPISLSHYTGSSGALRGVAEISSAASVMDPSLSRAWVVIEDAHAFTSAAIEVEVHATSSAVVGDSCDVTYTCKAPAVCAPEIDAVHLSTCQIARPPSLSMVRAVWVDATEAHRLQLTIEGDDPDADLAWVDVTTEHEDGVTYRAHYPVWRLAPDPSGALTFHASILHEVRGSDVVALHVSLTDAHGLRSNEREVVWSERVGFGQACVRAGAGPRCNGSAGVVCGPDLRCETSSPPALTSLSARRVDASSADLHFTGTDVNGDPRSWRLERIEDADGVVLVDGPVSMAFDSVSLDGASFTARARVSGLEAGAAPFTLFAAVEDSSGLVSNTRTTTIERAIPANASCDVEDSPGDCEFGTECRLETCTSTAPTITRVSAVHASDLRFATLSVSGFDLDRDADAVEVSFIRDGDTSATRLYPRDSDSYVSRTIDPETGDFSFSLRVRWRPLDEVVDVDELSVVVIDTQGNLSAPRITALPATRGADDACDPVGTDRCFPGLTCTSSLRCELDDLAPCGTITTYRVPDAAYEVADNTYDVPYEFGGNESFETASCVIAPGAEVAIEVVAPFDARVHVSTQRDSSDHDAHLYGRSQLCLDSGATFACQEPTLGTPNHVAFITLAGDRTFVIVDAMGPASSGTARVELTPVRDVDEPCASDDDCFPELRCALELCAP